MPAIKVLVATAAIATTIWAITAPSSSAKPGPTMTSSAQALLAKFEATAIAAKESEAALHKQMAQEVARAEHERAFAYRKLNLLRAVIDAVAPAKDEESATAAGITALRAELGWEKGNETCDLTRFSPVVRAIFLSVTTPAAEGDPATDVTRSFADFEVWYVETFKRPFWALFDREIEEMPIVER